MFILINFIINVQLINPLIDCLEDKKVSQLPKVQSDNIRLVYFLAMWVKVHNYTDKKDDKFSALYNQHLWRHTNLWEVSDVSLAEWHFLWFLDDVSVNDEYVGELGSETQLDLSTAVEVETHCLRKLWNNKKQVHLTEL